MASERHATQFAPAERADPRRMAEQAQLLKDESLLRHLYDAVSDIVLVLNEHRQIVFFNKNLLSVLRNRPEESIYGLRPGEAFSCSQVCEERGGCGTGDACSACGAVNAILTAQGGRLDARECHLVKSDTGEALDLLVRATPIELGGERFVICALKDISDQKRRRALERVFFHDLLNTATALRFMIMSGADDHEAGTALERLQPVVHRLVDEIQQQRDIAAAENVELTAFPTTVKSLAVMRKVKKFLKPIAESHCAAIRVDEMSVDATLHTDSTLLQRILANMVKNAVEADGDGGAVVLFCEEEDGGVRFSVHNCAAIPKAAQRQLFQRFFSTKGRGRGLGAYSMKMLTERYLGGRLWFESNAEQGTTFHAWFPKQLPGRA